MSVVKSGSGRARRDTEGLGDLAWGVPEEVMEHQDRALLSGQSSEPAIEKIPVRDVGEAVIRTPWSVERQHAEIRRPATLARRMGDADVHDEAAQPGIESGRIAKTPQVAPGDHQRVLDGVFRPIDVAENPVRDREEVVAATPDQVDIRLPITIAGRLDEVSVHRSPMLRPVGGRVRLPWEWRCYHRSFFSLGLDPRASR